MMKLSRSTVSMAATLVMLPALVLNGYCRNEGRRPSQLEAQTSGKSSPNNRQRRESGPTFKATFRDRDPNAPPWNPRIPATISVSINGVARDEAGKPVAAATITLYDTRLRQSKAAAQTTTDTEGRYAIRDAKVPVQTHFNGHAYPKEITPFAGFILCGLAPGRGVAWSPTHSMYAVKEPHPNDIQGRLPLGQPVVLDLTFPKAASLQGKVVDEDGAPVAGVKLRVSDCDLLDDAGRETNNRQGYDWSVLPERIGRAVTDRNGRFRD